MKVPSITGVTEGKQVLKQIEVAEREARGLQQSREVDIMITRSVVVGLFAVGLAAMALPAGAQMGVARTGIYAYELLWGPDQFGQGLEARMQGTPLSLRWRPLGVASFYTPGPFNAPGALAPGFLTPSYTGDTYTRGRAGIQLLPHLGTLSLSQRLWGGSRGY